MLLDVFLQVARQRGRHRHALLRQELCEVLLARLEQDRQVAAIDDLDPALPRRADEPPETGIQLRRTAGEVETGRRQPVQHVY